MPENHAARSGPKKSPDYWRLFGLCGMFGVMNMRASIGVVAAASGLLAAGGVAFGQSVVMLPSPAATVADLSDDGTRVIGAAVGARNYFWNSQSGLTIVNHAYTGAAGLPQVSGDGHTLVNISGESSTLQRAFIATDSGGYTVLPFTGAGASQAFPFGVSYDGRVVAGYDDFLSGGSSGWRWTAVGGIQTLPMGVVNGMSGDGNTVFGHDGASQAVVWHSGTTSRLLPAPGSPNSITGGITSNFDGSVIGGNSGLVPAIWVNGQGTLLPLLAGFSGGTVRDVSNDGSIAFGQYGISNPPNYFMWTAAGGTQSLTDYFATNGISLPGYTITEVHMSANGQTFGVTAWDAMPHAFVITIPAPGAAGVLLVAAWRPRRGGLAAEGDSGVVQRRRVRA